MESLDSWRKKSCRPRKTSIHGEDIDPHIGEEFDKVLRNQMETFRENSDRLQSEVILDDLFA